MDRVILEGGGNAELRSWKAFGQWVNIIHKASPTNTISKTRSLRSTQDRRLLQGAATLSEKVMGELRSRNEAQ